LKVFVTRDILLEAWKLRFCVLEMWSNGNYQHTVHFLHWVFFNFSWFFWKKLHFSLFLVV